MAEYIIVADNINGSERSILEKMKTTMESAGHTVEIGGVGPSVLQNIGGTSRATGKIGIQVVGGRCVGTAVDFIEGLTRGYYKFKMMGFAFCSWTATKYITCSDLKNYKFQGRAWDDGFSSEATLTKYKANTGQYSWSEWAAMYKDKLVWACGNSPEELAKNIVKGNSTSDSGGDSEPSSIKDVLKKLMSYNDGDIECRLEGNKVYINKIGNPADTNLLISEGRNIVDDSVSIKDYYPETVNILTVHWQGGDDIVYRDETLIARFGENPLELDAVKKITTTTTEETETTNDDGGTETETETTTETSEVPVETLEEAETFARIEWAKIKRDNGFSIDLKVIPDANYKVGQWVHAYIPSYTINKYMYITKLSNSPAPDSSTEIGLTLVDYPPSFGEYTEEESEDEEELEEEVEVEE